MNLTYERSGGFIGIAQKLELDGETLKFSDRRSRSESQRAITQDERNQLAAAVEAIQGAPVPESDRGVADGYQLKITLPERTVTLGTFGVPYGESDGSAWSTLYALLDGMLEAGLGKPRRPDLVDPELLK